ncbi:ankyrin repeat and SOCS box protein 2-like isoform X1 [Paramormyrops kingsleyae]|uniref:ankyrin repeat and SOCS box protein 2-like isoform X1 n=2 Tax=Paramormyrops kingsleyae TaxID=1676925 RepID=UPI003B97A0B9
MASGTTLQGPACSTLGSDDYSLYSGLSEEELLELAIERSLADSNAANAQVASSSKTAMQRQPSQSARQHVQAADQEVIPPTANPPGLVGATRSSYVTRDGQRMVAWRRYDGTLVMPEPEEEENPVIRAISADDVKTVKEMAKSDLESLTQPNKDGWLALHEAAYYGSLDCLAVLLRVHTGMINKRTPREQTPLFLAVSRDKLSCARHLLENGADPDLANKDRETPLFKACEQENVKMVELILKFGGGVNKICIQGWTALHEAVCRNNLQICEMLVEAGAKVGTPNMYGITPVFVAAQCGRVEALRFLIKSGADVNSQAADGATALYEASKNGHDDIVKILLSQNADANIAAKGGLLPLHIAAQRGNDREKLLNYASYSYCCELSVKIVSMLIPATSKARVRRSGISPLHLAAERNKNEVLETLIEAGFDVNAMLSPDRSKMYEDRRSTALYFAICNNNTEAATMLLEAGANPNLDTFNPLLIAVRQGCIRTVTLLVEHGANVNAYIPTHPTPFPAAIMFCMKYLTLLKYLLDNGCDAQSCFQCEYGSGPHPPIETLHRPRDDIRYNVDVQDYIPVQFCEMISTPSVSRWAGPIIDVLLDYVGNVQLCARLIEHLDSYEDWGVIKEKSILPRPLMQLCRLRILSLLGAERMQLIDSLPIPGRLLKFLRHEERSSQL